MAARRVLVPVVAPGGAARGEGDLIEVYAGPASAPSADADAVQETLARERRALTRDWDPIAMPLRPLGLYRAGLAAVNAARRVRARPPRLALTQRLRRVDPLDGHRLYAVAPRGVTEGDSAGLGLALALLLADQPAGAPVIATGALGASLMRAQRTDVAVVPVAAIPDKLRLLHDLAQRGALDTGGSGRTLILLPAEGFDGQAPDIAPSVAALNDLGFDVRPVASLGEALRHLRLPPARLQGADIAALAGIAGLTFALLSVTLSQSALRAAVPLRFEAPRPGMAQRPFVLCPKTGAMVGFHDDTLTALAPPDTAIGWRAVIGEAPPTTAWLGFDRAHVAQMLIFERTGVQVMVPSDAGGVVTFRPGEEWRWGWRIDEAVEAGALLLLARWGRAFDADALRERLTAAFPELARPEAGRFDVGQIAARARRLAPGGLVFFFRTSEEAQQCEEGP